MYLEKDIDLLCKSNINKVLIINTGQIAVKSSKTSVGVNVLKSKENSFMDLCMPLENVKGLRNVKYYEGNVNSIGKYLKKDDEIIC
jgi:hypothetical protein